MGELSAFAVAAVVGILSGMGVGGGTLLMIWLSVFAGKDQLTTQGINLIYFLPTSAAGIAVHLKNRLVSGRAFAFCAPAAVVGAVLGSLLAGYVGSAVLRKIFGAGLVFVGLWQMLGKKP